MGAIGNNTATLDLDSEGTLPSCVGSRYEVLERLGRGGMAVVYRVRDRSRPGELALKQWLAAGSAQRDTRTLFENEFCALAQLRHPSIVDVYDYGIDAAGPYYTMELLDSGDLSSRAPLPFRQACELAAQVCSALSLLHSRRLLHRDVSPRNVRLTRDGHAKLIDFGAMVPMGPCVQGVGTPGFVAPEVVHHLPLDARTDLFSLGATLYYALTGKRPFNARTLAELAEAWRREPTPPGELIAGIPEALDALVLSLLRMDPATRPSRAFEVMQRLAAISGRPLPDSAKIVRAYLSTPVLVGREAQQRKFRGCLRRAVQGSGEGVFFQGSSGSGRTRLLDACVLEAKTGGATVLRVDGRAARHEAFAGARRLAEQVLEAFPDRAHRCAQEVGVTVVLFGANAGVTAQATPELLPLVRWNEDAYTVQVALFAWLQRMSREQPIAIAADDAERIDAPTLALLVALADAASGVPMLLMIGARSPIDANAHPAMSALQERCSVLQLEPLAADETDALFASVFSDVPHASLVSARIHRVAAGNPREAMVLAQHMLDRQLIRYTDGHWILPASLELSELPASAEDALRSQLTELPALPRRLAEAQALALDAPWTTCDYSAFAATSVGGEDNTDQVAGALALLMRQGVVVEHAGAYTLTHPGVRACLTAHLSATDRTSHQLALADWCIRTHRHGLVEVYHLLHARSFDRALERLGPLLDGSSRIAALYRESGVELRVIAEILEQAHALSRARGRKSRETHEMAQLLLELSVSTEEALYDRYAPDWLAQLERDSGLADYRATDASLPASTRLQRALEQAGARYADTPESQRVYPLDQAIKALAHYVVMSIVFGSRTLDTKLLASLPGLLEPFSTLSPVLYALWQNAISVTEATYKGQFEQARTRELDVYRRLEPVAAADVPYLDAIRGAIASGVANMEVTLGYPTAQQWISIMEQDPLQRVMALHLRRALCISDGDADGAERFRKQAEVFALQSGVRSMFNPPIALELYLQVHAGDLTAVKQAADRLAQLAAKWPGWVAQHEVAQGFYHRMRGDRPAAKLAFERALAAARTDRVDPPPMLRTWVNAVEGYISVLIDGGELQQARAFGLHAIERCEALGMSGCYGHLRPLALAEAKLGDHASAAKRLDAMIAQRAERRPSMLLLDYEVRARVAILAGDGATAAHFTRLVTTADGAADGGARRLATRARLIDEARRAGIDLDVPLSGFESALRVEHVRPAPGHAAHALVAAAIADVHDSAARAQRALELLAQALDASTGQLYYVSTSQLQCAATLGPREPALDRFANGYWRQRQAQSGLTTVLTAPQNDTYSLPTGEWTSPSGVRYRIIPLSPLNEPECIGLVALRTDAKALIPSAYWWLSAAIGARLLACGDVVAPGSPH